MKPIIPAVVVCVLSSLVIGCHSLSKMSGGQTAKIYVLRRLSMTGSGRITVKDNGKQVGTIDRGGSLNWRRSAGTATITIYHGDSEAKQTLTVEANQTYYLEVRASHATAGHPKVVQIQVLSAKEGEHVLSVINHEFGG
jgi:hypothetical protein